MLYLVITHLVLLLLLLQTACQLVLDLQGATIGRNMKLYDNQDR